MGNFLDVFPRTIYDINRSSASNYETVTNIFFRMSIIKETIDNTSSYYIYSIKESDKPETLAENVYNDPQAYWMILYANDMVDPQYDWPLNYNDFGNYIVNKYGSVANSQTSIHHYEKVIDRKVGVSQDSTMEVRVTIDYANTSNTVPSTYHYDYYTGMASSEYTTYSVANTTVHETITKEAVSCYDYEERLNFNKRLIKIIRPIYYSQIMSEFLRLTDQSKPPSSFLRRLT